MKIYTIDVFSLDNKSYGQQRSFGHTWLWVSTWSGVHSSQVGIPSWMASITIAHLLQIAFLSAVFSNRWPLLELQMLLLFVKSHCCVWPSSADYISARSTCKVRQHFPSHTTLLCCEILLWFFFLRIITYIEEHTQGKCCCFHLHSIRQWLLRER